VRGPPATRFAAALEGIDSAGERASCGAGENPTNQQRRNVAASPPDLPDAETETVAGRAHVELGRVGETRRDSAETREQAKALQAQAAHQQRRADRNVAAARELRTARVLVVDDSDAYLAAAASVVSSTRGLRLVGAARSGEEAIRRFPGLMPDLVLLDIRMPGLDGFETARILRRRHPETVVVLASAEPGGCAGAARSAGAAALVNKAGLTTEVLDALWQEHRPHG
jgi:CheY-like chemotaxis protein